MNVVFVDTTLTTPPTGGAQTFLTDLCASLNAQGHRTSVVTNPGPDTTIPESLRKAGTNVLTNISSPRHLPEERAIHLASWVNKERPDVYNISISSDAGWLALPLLDPSIATISIAHADVSAFYEPLRHYAPFIDCAVGVSEAIHKRIIDQCSIPPARARYVPYGVTSLLPSEIAARQDRQFDQDEPLRIVYLGRLVQDLKRVLDLVPLAKELKRREIPFELHLVGDGPERPALESGFEKHDVTRNVTFWGWLTPEAVKQRLWELDALVLLSDSEGLPLALLESMGHGVVPVVTNLEGGITEVVKDGQNGYTAAIGDIATFADRLETLARDKHLLRSLKSAAWETSREFSTERMVERYFALFQYLTAPEFSREHRKDAAHPYPVMQSCKSAYPIWLRKLKRRVLITANPAQGSN
jgi:glycosyltransferase involved in cell wall biosynthesis